MNVSKLIKPRNLFSLIFLAAILTLAIFFIIQNRSKADTALNDIEERNGWTRTCYNMKGFNPTMTSESSSLQKITCPPEIKFYKSNTAHTTDSGYSLTMLTGKMYEQDNKLVIAQDSNGQAVTPGTKYRLSFYLKIANRTCYDTQYYNNNKYYDTTTSLECNPETGGSNCKKSCGDTVNGIHPGINPFNCYTTTAFADNGVDATHAPFCGQYDVLLRDPNQIPAPVNEGSYKSTLATKFTTATVKYKNQDWFYNTYDFTTLNNTTSLDFMIKQAGFTGYLYIDELHLEKIGPGNRIDSFVSDEEMKTPVNYPNVMSIDSSQTVDTPNNPTFATNATKFSFGSTNLKFAHKDNLARFLANLSFPSGYLSDMAIDSTNQGVRFYENNNVKIAAAADSTAIIKLKQDFNLTLTGIPAAYHFYRNGLLFLRDAGSQKLFDETVSPYGNGFFFTPILSTGDLNQYSTDPANTTEYTPIINPSLKKWNDPTVAQFTNGTWSITYSGKAGDAYFMSVFPPKTFDKQKFCNQATTMASGINSMRDGSDWWDKAKQKIASLSNFVNTINLWDYYYQCSDTNNCPSLENTTDAGNNDTVSLLEVFNSKYGSTWKYDLQWPKELNPNAPWFQNISEIRNKFGMKSLVYMSPNFHLDFNNVSLVGQFINNIGLKDAEQNYLVDGAYLDSPMSTDLIKNLIFMRKVRSEISDPTKRAGNGQLVLHSSGNTWFFDSRAGRDDAKDPDGARFTMPFVNAYADIIWTGESSPYTADDFWLNNYTDFGVSNSITQLLMENRSLSGSNPTMTPLQQNFKQLKDFGQGRNILTWPNYYEGYVKNDENENEDINVFNMSAYYRTWRQYCQPITKNNNKCDFQETYTLANNDTAGKNDCAPKDSQNPNITYRLGNETKSESANPVVNWLVNNNPLFQLHYNFDDADETNGHVGVFTDSSGNKLDANLGGPNDNVFPTYENLDNRKLAVFDGSARLAGFHGSLLASDGTQLQDRTPILNMANKDFSVFSLIKKTNRNDNADHTIYAQDKTRRKITCKTTEPPSPADCDLPYCGGTVTSGCIPFAQATKIYISNYAQELQPSLSLGINDTSSQDKVTVKIKKTDNSQFICTSNQTVDDNWHMVGFTFDKSNSKITIYIDGIADTVSCLMPTGAVFDDTLFSIGALSKSRETFYGKIDDLFVSSSLLSGEQITSLYGDGGANYLKKIYMPDGLLNLPLKPILNTGFRQYESTIPVISITSDKQNATHGETVTYTLTYQNYSGEAVTLSNLSNPIPTSMTMKSYSSTGLITRANGTTTQNINRNYDVPTRTLQWIFNDTNPGLLNPGDKFVGTFQVTVN